VGGSVISPEQAVNFPQRRLLQRNVQPMFDEGLESGVALQPGGANSNESA
jgi:hypothetical protein